MNSCISVVIPTKNGGELFRRSLEMIFLQKIESQLEVIVVDSGSTDHTLSICAEYPVRLIQIPASTFNHSSARNLALSKSSGSICVLTVQDAVPVDRNWLATLVGPMVKNDRIAGVFGQQISTVDASCLSKCCKVLWYQEWRSDWQQEYEQGAIKPDDWQSMSAVKKRRVSRFDNVNSCIRKSVWQKIPFPDVPYAEDIAWAIDVLTAGYSIFWQPNAQVFHTHDRPLFYEFQRSYVDVKNLTAIFQDGSSSLTYSMARSVVSWLAKESGIYLKLSHSLVELDEEVKRIEKADEVWQVEINERNKAVAQNNQNAQQYLIMLFMKKLLWRQYYCGVTGPQWLRTACRNFLQKRQFFQSKVEKNSADEGGFLLQMQGCHRFFLNQLLCIYYTEKDMCVDSNDAIRLGSAVMVAGSFLGQHMKEINKSVGNLKSFEEQEQSQATKQKAIWNALDDWYKTDYGQEHVALTRLNQILTEGV